MADYSTLLRDSVTLTCRSIDRLFFQGYVPRLQSPGLICRFLIARGFPMPSSAALGKIGDAYVAAIHRFAEERGIPVIHFKKGERKEETARPFLERAAAAGESRVVLIGIAQEKASAWRSWRAKVQPYANRPQMEWGREMAFVNHFYFYLWDLDWGPAFWKTNAYAPYPVWIWLNGHEWAKRQLARLEVGFDELDNGLWRVDDAEAAQRVCASLHAGQVRAFIERWLPRLPSPLIAADRAAGFAWSYSIRQLELSDTAVFDRPQAGRAWFEAAIRDQLSLGRPDKIRIVFGRQLKLQGANQTRGRFATQVITRGVYPRIEIAYKSCAAKAYFKAERALRVETTINNASDFELKKTLNATNWRALRQTAAQINARFLAALGEHEPGLPDSATLTAVVLPSVHAGQRAPGLRFGDPRVTALLGALCLFDHLWHGLTNASLRAQMTQLFDHAYSSAKASYDLRRLRLKGLIERLPGRHRYQVTAYGRRIATFFTRLTSRVVVPALSQLDASSRPPRHAPTPLAAAWRAYDSQLRALLQEAGLAAQRRRPRSRRKTCLKPQELIHQGAG
jgi:hypothetical protein